MLVNGIDIRKYNAKQLTVNLQPPKISVNSEWVKGAATPHEFETEVQYGTLEITILFRGTGRNNIVRKVSEFLSLMTKRSRIQLDGYKGTYIGDMTSDSLKKTKAPDRYILTVKFNGYLVDNVVTNVYKSAHGAKFMTLGTRDAPCGIMLHPLSHPHRTIMNCYVTLVRRKSDDVFLIFLQDGECPHVAVCEFIFAVLCDRPPLLRRTAPASLTFGRKITS